MMDGQYHNPNDFWRQRMEPWEYDSIEAGWKKFVKAVAVVGASAFVLWLLCGCRSWKHGVIETTDTKESVRIEYREKIVKVPVVVEVEVPVEEKERLSGDSVSHLETSFAVSDAKIIWIDGVAFLNHTLANKPQKIAKSDSVPVTEKEKIVWKTRRVTYTKTEIREKKLAWWQTGLMWTGAISLIALFILLIVRFFLRR